MHDIGSEITADSEHLRNKTQTFNTSSRWVYTATDTGI